MGWVEQLLCYAIGCEIMEVIHFADLGESPRDALQGKRWLIVRAKELHQATGALMFSELEDVLVAVDHRGLPPVDGLWMRAVHLLLVDEETDAEGLQLQSGITKVIAQNTGGIEQYLW
ncbi:hypothetical protein OAO46_01050 [Candidatus Poseidonia alphae]|nr:hypothetical protein [Candidatus Poseidonia alphae]